MQAPILHFAEMREQLGERPTLCAQHATEALQQLRVGEMLEPPRATIVSHGQQLRAPFFGPRSAPQLPERVRGGSRAVECREGRT
jgi:hypothetical protein